jgi:hypothetical protein
MLGIDRVAGLDTNVLRPALHLEVLAHVVVSLDVATEAILFAVEFGLVMLLALLEQAVAAIGRMLCILTLGFAARPRLPLLGLPSGRLRALLSFGVALGALLVAAIVAHHASP